MCFISPAELWASYPKDFPYNTWHIAKHTVATKFYQTKAMCLALARREDSCVLGKAAEHLCLNHM